MNIGNIFERVAKWNSLRYDRIYNHDLAVALLEEELQEYFDAETVVDQLDAMCDTVYVALGILWKLNVDNHTLDYNAEESYRQTALLLETNTFDPVYFAYAVLQRCKYDNDYPVTLAAQMLVTLCLTQVSAMGLTNEEAFEAMIVVCDSNDSKSVKKVNASIKANAGDKGAFFMPPEPKLRLILAKVEARNGY